MRKILFGQWHKLLRKIILNSSNRRILPTGVEPMTFLPLDYPWEKWGTAHSLYDLLHTGQRLYHWATGNSSNQFVRKVIHVGSTPVGRSRNTFSEYLCHSSKKENAFFSTFGSPFNTQECLTSNFSLQCQYVVKQTGDENKEIHQLRWFQF